MLDRINWNLLKAFKWDYSILIKIISTLILLFLLFIYFRFNNGNTLDWTDIFSISIGLFSVFLAIGSIRSTTLSFNETQADYWNTRGLDDIGKKDYHNADQAYDKAIDLDPHSLKSRINKANGLLNQGKRYNDKSILINAFNVIDEAVNMGPKIPATFWKNSSREKKAKQEYANALKTKCDILLELAGVSDKGLISQNYNNFAHIHFDNQSRDCDLLKSPFSIDTLPSSLILRACAFKASKEAIKEYPKKNSELPGAYLSKGNALHHIGKYDDAIRAYERVSMAVQKVLNHSGIKVLTSTTFALARNERGDAETRGVYRYEGFIPPGIEHIRDIQDHRIQ